MQLSRAATTKLAKALKVGGMVPDLRATRIKEIAQRVQDKFEAIFCLLSRAFTLAQVRKALKAFPGIGNPGADRIVLFSRLAPVAAVPSSCPHVLVRVLQGPEGDKYAPIYAAAQRVLDTLPVTFDARINGYLLIDRHGHALCKRSNPLCARCPLAAAVRFCKWIPETK